MTVNIDDLGEADVRISQLVYLGYIENVVDGNAFNFALELDLDCVTKLLFENISGRTRPRQCNSEKEEGKNEHSRVKN